jgi:hypothetical protein
MTGVDEGTLKVAAEIVVVVLLAALVAFDLGAAPPRRGRILLAVASGLLIVAFLGLVGERFILVAT